MKSVRRFFAFSTIILAASCTVKLDQEILKPELEERVITITARAETGSTTKTELSQAGDGAVLWSPGDEISVFYGNGTDGGSRFTSSATEAVAITDFTGTIETIAGGIESAPEGTWFWGLYPYTPTASCDGSSVTMTLSAEQVATAGTFAPGASPSIGRSKNPSIGFYNICGGVKFSVTHEGIKKVTLRSNGGELIAGTARVSFSDAGLPVVEEILSGTDAITLEAPVGETFEVGALYCMMAFPTVLSSGFTLTLETMTESAEVEKSGSITITRSILGRLDDVDEGATYTQKYDNVPIPDANFKAYLVSHFDTDGDGEISLEEAEAITKIESYTNDITSVQGIEYMPSLRSLSVRGSSSMYSGQLTSLDVSNNMALTELNCSYNQLTSLDVSNNTALTHLNCSYNQLTSLEVSNNTALTYLDCIYNQLTSLDVSNNTALTFLDCCNNQLTSLDVSNNTALMSLRCCINQLTSLQVSNNTALTYLDCSRNQLTSLDVSNNTALTYLACSYNQLSSLDVSNNTALTGLDCYNNQLTSLDMSNNTALTSLSCPDNQLTSLTVPNNTALKELNCINNQLTSLDVSDNAALTRLRCYNNQLISLDVSNNPALESLACYNNQLTFLNVSNDTALTQFDCSDNKLTSLDVSSNTALVVLNCYNNQLTSLDVSSNTALGALYCPRNQLTSLNVSNNVVLSDLSCSSNQLTSLDVSNNTALILLYCYDNLLTTLDVSNNTALTTLWCYGNQLTSLDVSNNTALNSFDCSPMESLETLFLAPGQEIPKITSNRSDNYIPAGTQIVVAPPACGD